MLKQFLVSKRENILQPAFEKRTILMCPIYNVVQENFKQSERVGHTVTQVSRHFTFHLNLCNIFLILVRVNMYKLLIKSCLNGGKIVLNNYLLFSWPVQWNKQSKGM